MNHIASVGEEGEEFEEFWDSRPVLRQLLNLETGLPVQWDNVLERMDLFPDEVKWRDPNDGTSFLHEALCCYDDRSMPKEVVIKAIEIYPQSLNQAIMPFGSILHLACLSDCLSFDSFQLILKTFPEASFPKYEIGLMSPLDKFIFSITRRKRLTSHCVKIVRALLDINVTPSVHPTRNWDIIISLWNKDTYTRRNSITYLGEITDLFLRARAKYYAHQKHSGKCHQPILHRLIKETYSVRSSDYRYVINPSRRVFENKKLCNFFVTKYRAHMSHADVNGKLCLHLALARGLNWKTIKKLCRIEPRSCGTRDVQSRMYPFMIASVGETSCLDSSFDLLVENPCVIRAILDDNILGFQL